MVRKIAGSSLVLPAAPVQGWRHPNSRSTRPRRLTPNSSAFPSWLAFWHSTACLRRDRSALSGAAEGQSVRQQESLAGITGEDVQASGRGRMCDRCSCGRLGCLCGLRQPRLARGSARVSCPVGLLLRGAPTGLDPTARQHMVLSRRGGSLPCDRDPLSLAEKLLSHAPAVKPNGV